MKTVFQDGDSALLGLYQSILEDAGIQTVIHNVDTFHAIAGSGGAAFAPIVTFPELRVIDDEDYPQAIELLRRAREGDSLVGAEWKCAGCGETVPGNFTSCWNCGLDRAEKT